MPTGWITCSEMAISPASSVASTITIVVYVNCPGRGTGKIVPCLQREWGLIRSLSLLGGALQPFLAGVLP